MKLIIAEKPSVAREFASYLRALDDKKGYYEGNGYCVTWAYGHLVGLADPDEYGWKKWVMEDLPLVPDKFKFIVSESSKAQFIIVERLIKNCAEIIVGTDAGREGELIFRYIYEKVGVRKPFKRMWLSSLTNEAINNGFASLKEGKDYDNLYYSALSRAESDWLIGMNFSRMLTLSAGDGKKTITIGRVQTPTLSIICQRYLENKNFVKEAFYTPILKLTSGNIAFIAKFESNFKTEQQAKEVLTAINNSIICSNITQTKKIEKSPTLFDLTTLQRVAENKFGYSAAKTLEYAQVLYEQKLTTYPRTDSSYLSDDMQDMVTNTINFLANPAIFSIQDKSHFDKIKMLSVEDNKVFDNSKVTDHHAIIPTGKVNSNWKDVELQNIYKLILERFFMCFYTDCHKIVRKYDFSSGNGLFSATGISIINLGWRVFEIFEAKNDESEIEENTQNLPNIEKGMNVEILQKSVKESFTTPMPIHTESSLLGVMENPTKAIENKLLLKTVKDLGLGTPATRHTMIELLIHRQYVKKIGRKLVPTDFGLSIFSFVKEYDFAKADLTAIWEAKLNQMARGDYQREKFKVEIVNYLNENINIIKNSSTKIDSTDHSIIKIPCPKCKMGTMIERELFWGCTEFKDKTCDFSISKTLFQKKISNTQLQKLMLKGKTDLITGFISKVGKPFNALLKLGDDYKIGLEFDNKK